MKCSVCGYDDLGTGDSAHVCGTSFFMRAESQNIGATHTLEAERAEFEAWASNHLGQGYPLTMDEHVYEHPVTRWAFKAWQAARRAAPVAEDVALPPLPPIDEHWMTNDHTYTAEQVRQAQRTAYEAGKLAAIAEFQRGVASDLEGIKARIGADRTAGLAAPEVTSEEPRAQVWQPMTGPGQVRKGDKLRFKIGDKEYKERAKLILEPGTSKEEVVYDIGRNFYFITSMVISCKSNHKDVEFLAAAPKPKEDA